jgi:hypothetical protein
MEPDVVESDRYLLRVPPDATCPGCAEIGGGHTCPACVVRALAAKRPDAREAEVRATLLAHRCREGERLERWIRSLLRNA